MSSYQYGSPSRHIRKSSPLHHQKSPSYAHRSNATPVQITQKKVPLDYAASPERLSEADMLRQRNAQLETQLCQTKTDLEMAKYANNRSRDSEGKADNITRQNSQLAQENDNIQRQLNQKKNEVDIWKNKYETQMNTLIQMKANYEMDMKNQQKEIEEQKEYIGQMSQNIGKEAEVLKQTIQEEGKDRIEFIKQTHSKNSQLYEEQLRKMKDIIEDREKEVNELNYKLQNVRAAAEVEAARINDDREKLRMRNQQLELQVGQELDLQKSKIDVQNEQQLLSLKKLHQNELDILESEGNNQKQLLEVKNEEIQALMNQNRQQKNNFDNENDELKAEIQNLQEKINENNYNNQEEINDLKEKLATLHITDIQEMKLRNESISEALTNENQKLKELLAAKSEELDNQIKEKLEQREQYNNEIDRHKQDLNKQRLNHMQTMEEKKNDTSNADQHLKEVEKAHEEHTQQLEDHIQFLETELEKLKALIVKKNNETDRHIARSNTLKSNLDDDVRKLKAENDQWRASYENLEYEKENLIEEYKQKLNQQDAQNIEIKRSMEEKINYLEAELAKANENIKLKSEEVYNHQQFRAQQELEIQKLQNQIENLNNQLVQQERQKTQELDEQRFKLEQSNQMTVDTLKASHKNQQAVLEQEIQNLKRIIEQKDKEIMDMIEKYRTIETAFNEFSQSQDKLSDYETKLKLLGSEIVTTKNLYDVFVKTKSRFSKRSGEKQSPSPYQQQQQQQQYQQQQDQQNPEVQQFQASYPQQEQ